MTKKTKAEELLALQSRLLGAMNAGRGFQGLADELAGSLNRPVIIVNAFQRVMAASGLAFHLPWGNTLTLSPVEGKDGYYHVGSQEAQWEAYRIPIPARGDHVHGYLLVIDAQDQEYCQAMGQLAAGFASLQFGHLETLKEMERRHRDTFIFDLLYNNIDNEETIIAWGELWGWDLKRTTAVAVFALEGYDHSTADQDIMKALFAVGEEVFDLNGVPPILTIKRGELVAIISLKDHRRKPGRKVINKIITDFLAMASPVLGKRVVRLGVGRRYASPTEIFRSYQEAKVALELGKLIQPSNKIPYFADLGMARLLFSHDWQELQEFYLETFRDLRDPELMETLETYISHGCDLKTTAKALFLHPNSLRYRLKKIEELLERDLEELETRVDLVVALKIKRLLGFN